MTNGNVVSKSNGIYPNADLSEVISRVTKSSVGRFYKQYKKGSFIYTIEKKPLQQMTVMALHIPTKTVFTWDPFFLEWVETGFKFDEI